MKTYDLVKEILTLVPDARNSDKVLIWEVWRRQHRVQGIVQEFIKQSDFYKAASIESIVRARRKVQQLVPSLRASTPVEKRRRVLAANKGTHIFRENV